ncbi:MAG: preprotein translocase subunit SecE [Lachnospiraceae bacterium]|nr:preprotein translocase subunit SecE [Lachnospiraceae bacterium]
MGESVNTKTDKAPKKSFFKGVKAEFKKIIWPDKKTLGKQAIAVVSISVVLGLIITLIDFILQYGINFLVK